jgi:hypothetical protein
MSTGKKRPRVSYKTVKFGSGWSLLSGASDDTGGAEDAGGGSTDPAWLPELPEPALAAWAAWATWAAWAAGDGVDTVAGGGGMVLTVAGPTRFITSIAASARPRTITAAAMYFFTSPFPADFGVWTCARFA